RTCSSCLHLCLFLFFIPIQPPPVSTLFPYTTLFRSGGGHRVPGGCAVGSDRCAAHGSFFKEESAGCLYFPGGKDSDSERAGLHRSEEHTSELQSRFDLVCRLLLEKKKREKPRITTNK